MSSVSEQDHLNPRDPLYYAPRWLRDRSATSREVAPATTFSPESFDSRLEGAVADSLRHPLDPEVMREPEPEPKGALWSVAARFAAAIGVSAVVALFFVIVVPGSRQGESEPATTSGVAQTIKSALFQSKEATPKPAISEFQAILAATPPGSPATSEPSGQLLKKFMQWREDPAQAAPPRTNQ
ncbi:hypothetical protein [Bradyrhizobium sp.]|uniref:hypothetical protein n=1 Tax=Bradyrhizobium sp. TaxID=376 RepID=UPI0025BA44F1|nr:hypothetical protein [Bradyrhizobium sp.]